MIKDIVICILAVFILFLSISVINTKDHLYNAKKELIETSYKLKEKEIQTQQLKQKIETLSERVKIKNYIGEKYKNVSYNDINRIIEYSYYFSKKFNIDVCVILSIIEVESSFRVGVFSSSGAHGITQLMPTTKKWISTNFEEIIKDENIKDKQFENILLSCIYVIYLINEYNDLELALIAYHKGPGNLNRMIETSTIDYKYSEKVISNYINLKNVVLKESYG